MQKCVCIFPNNKSGEYKKAVGEVASKLISLGFSAVTSHGEYANGKVALLPVEEAFSKSDFIVALGGDGTMLAAAGRAIKYKKPVLGINLGTLGYMAELDYGELELLDNLNNGFETERRMMLDIEINGEKKATVLNEAVVSRESGAQIASLELFCDSSRVCSYRADGLIIATPTGSSAYALSAGGPIIDTKLDAICVCPICSHSLSGSRALVFSPDSEIRVCANENRRPLCVTADGKVVSNINVGDSVVISKSDSALELIRLKKHSFYDTLYKKLS